MSIYSSSDSVIGGLAELFEIYRDDRNSERLYELERDRLRLDSGAERVTDAESEVVKDIAGPGNFESAVGVNITAILVVALVGVSVFVAVKAAG